VDWKYVDKKNARVFLMGNGGGRFDYQGQVTIGRDYVHVLCQEGDEEFEVWIPHHEVKLIDTLTPREEEELKGLGGW